MRDSKDLMERVLAEMLNSGGMESKETTSRRETCPSVEGQEHPPISKSFTQTCSCLKEMQGQKNGIETEGKDIQIPR